MSGSRNGERRLPVRGMVLFWVWVQWHLLGATAVLCGLRRCLPARSRRPTEMPPTWNPREDCLQWRDPEPGVDPQPTHSPKPKAEGLDSSACLVLNFSRHSHRSARLQVGSGSQNALKVLVPKICIAQYRPVAVSRTAKAHVIDANARPQSTDSQACISLTLALTAGLSTLRISIVVQQKATSLFNPDCGPLQVSTLPLPSRNIRAPSFSRSPGDWSARRSQHHQPPAGKENKWQ